MIRTIFFVALFLLTVSSIAQNIDFDAANPQPDLVEVYAGSFGSGDIDGDGDTDLIMTGLNPGRKTALYLNDGMGDFTEVEDTPFPDASTTVTIFEDLDGDGDLDLFFSGIGFQIQEFTHIYLNDGDGVFTQFANPELPDFAETGIEMADVDGDNDTDILMVGVNGEGEFMAEIFLNDGSANFSASQNTSITPLQMASLAFIDVDDDGDEDIIASGEEENETASVMLYLNDGEGNFTADMDAGFTPLNADDIDVADIDNDGDLDVLMSGISDASGVQTLLYTNNGSGQFDQLEATGIQNTFAGANAFADFDNDSDMDIIVIGTQAGGLPNIYNIVYENLGDNTFTAADTLGGEYIAACVVGEFNGDDLPDIIIQGFVDNTNVYWNNSSVVVSIGETESEPLHIYPNPTSGLVNIPLEDGLHKSDLRIFSSRGQLVYEQTLISGIHNAILLDLPSGSYFCTVSSFGSIRTAELLILK